MVKIKSLVRDKERFIKRRQRLVGPEGETLKALEILTECYMLVQGSTVTLIGHYKKLKVARRVVEEVMKNIHPVYHIKELMIKRELAKDEKLKTENWARFLPEFKKMKDNKKRKRKLLFKKKKKEGHAPSIQPRKEDLAMETGEYFMTQEEKLLKLRKEKIKQQKLKRSAKLKARKQQYQEPDQTPSEVEEKRKKFGLQKMNLEL